MRIKRTIYKRYIKLFGKRAIYRRLGIELLLDPKNQVDYRLAACLPFETEQINYAQKIIQDNNITTFLDIGANIGLYSIILGNISQLKVVHAFEPVKTNYNQLCANIFLNKLDAKIEAHRIALSSATAEEDIYISPSATGCSRLNPNYSGNPEDFIYKELVKTAPLDNHVPLIGERIFMKIDVEGHAVKAILGMSETLSKNFVIIQVELLEYDREKIISCLLDMGYSLFQEIGDDGYFATHRLPPKKQELEILTE